MGMQYEIRIDGKLLLATASGEPADMAELKRYGADLIAVGVKNACTKALLDERELEHTLNEGDIYFLAEQYSTSLPSLAKAAIVFDSEYTQNVEFWETCAVNRGLSIRVFKSIETALAWLNDDHISEVA